MKTPAEWTIGTYVAHNEALRKSERKFQDERDRRYIEVKAAEEKALLVKEQADRVALELAREIQTYKDEKANELRQQIENERGSYATRADISALAEKFDIAHKPVMEFMAKQIGHSQGSLDNRILIAWGVALLASLLTIWSLVSRPTAQVVIPTQQENR